MLGTNAKECPWLPSSVSQASMQVMSESKGHRGNEWMCVMQAK